jgi:hypothetical protein
MAMTMPQIADTPARARRSYRARHPWTMLALCGALSFIMIGTLAVSAVI